MQGTIYKIINNNNSKVYVGSTVKKLNHRMNEHKADAKRKGGTSKLHRAMNELGFDKFVIHPIEVVDDLVELDQLREREKYYIEELKAIDEGYNTRKSSRDRKPRIKKFTVSDVVIEFFEQNKASIQGRKRIPSTDLYKQYTTWCEDRELKPVTRPIFGYHSTAIMKKTKIKTWHYHTGTLDLSKLKSQTEPVADMTDSN